MGNEMSVAMEKMAQGPRLADVWDIDRKMALVFGAWIEMHQKLANYNAVAAPPWTEASKRFLEAIVGGNGRRKQFHLQIGGRRLRSGVKSPTKN